MLDDPARTPRRLADEDDAPEAWILCRACEARVTQASARTTVGPSELHTFVNPQGQVFELLCFTRAPGASAHGEATLRFSWFPGHRWRFALCRSCAAQLGWSFEGPQQFWGLDRAALILPRP